MKYAIQNNSGRWWTGSCWGVEQARKEYHGLEYPLQIDADNSNYGSILEMSEDRAGFIVYYLVNRDGDLTSPEARVVGVREAGDQLQEGGKNDN